MSSHVDQLLGLQRRIRLRREEPDPLPVGRLGYHVRSAAIPGEKLAVA